MIVCNTRCLADPFTGVQRYVTEILARLPEVRRLAPPSTMPGKLGHVWEQSVLPLSAPGALIWNPANTGQLIGPVRQVVTLHDLTMLDGPDSGSLPRRARYYRWMLPKLLRRASGILTVSEASKAHIGDLFDIAPGKIRVTPLGVDHGRFRPQDEASVRGFLAARGVTPGYVFTLGSGSRRKNYRRLLEAWAAAQTSVPESVELVVAGDVDAHTKAFDGTALGDLPPRVRLVGRVPDDELPAWLAGAGLFAFPSLQEGFGLPILEAMACGTACLTSNTSSLPEVAGDAAILVDPTDTAAIAEGLRAVLADPGRRAELERQGLERAAGFTWERTARETLAFLSACRGPGDQRRA